jgi:hypothetical protein
MADLSSVSLTRWPAALATRVLKVDDVLLTALESSIVDNLR